MIRSFFTNSVGILVSRILGFIRDILTASTLGASLYSDIFFVAFKLPNLLRRIFGEGAFTQSFLPAFTKSKAKGMFALGVFSKFIFFILILCFLVTIFAPFVTKIFAIGFDANKIELTYPVLAINFYYLLFIFIVTFAASLLNYKDHFATTAFSTALLNISMITALLLSDKNNGMQSVYYLSFGVLIGGFLQALVHLIALKYTNMLNLLKKAFLLRKSHKKDDPQKKIFFKTFFHSIVGGSAMQISAFIDTWFASFLALGSISYLYYANRIFQLPLAMFAIALSTAIFPKILKYIKQNNEEEATKYLEKGFWFLFSLLSIATAGGIVLYDAIMILLFERGEFNRNDSIESGWVLAMYLVGLIPFGITKLFSLWLYAKQQQKKAAYITIISLFINVLFSVALIKPMGAGGLALASSISGWALFFFTIKFYGFRRFLAIIVNKNLIILLLFIFIEILLLLYLRKLFYVYI